MYISILKVWTKKKNMADFGQLFNLIGFKYFNTWHSIESYS